MAFAWDIALLAACTALSASPLLSGLKAAERVWRIDASSAPFCIAALAPANWGPPSDESHYGGPTYVSLKSWRASITFQVLVPLSW